jgi:hypothetical protein
MVEMVLALSPQAKFFCCTVLFASDLIFYLSKRTPRSKDPSSRGRSHQWNLFVFCQRPPYLGWIPSCSRKGKGQSQEVCPHLWIWGLSFPGQTSPVTHLLLTSFYKHLPWWPQASEPDRHGLKFLLELVVCLKLLSSKWDQWDQPVRWVRWDNICTPSWRGVWHIMASRLDDR